MLKNNNNVHFSERSLHIGSVCYTIMRGLFVVHVIWLSLVTKSFSGNSAAPKKVAILGGGASSCVTALALTGQPGWKERYDITIYQLGWRLGGKAASGRNQEYGQRVEEVTPHLLGGVFHNTKRLLRSVYEELGRPDGGTTQNI